MNIFSMNFLVFLYIFLKKYYHSENLPAFYIFLKHTLNYGLLSKVKDYKDMSNKIRLLLEDEKLYEKYKKLGEKRANDFRPNVIREKLNKILGEID